MARDCLLREVLENLPERLHLEAGDAGELLERRLHLILKRAKEELKDFEGFYCLRLVLDRQSPLASYFIDLFSHLEFLILELSRIPKRPSTEYNAQEVLDSFLKYLRPVSDTCRLLYATCKMLPTSAQDPLCQIAAGEFKRKGQRRGRQFSSSLLHCRMRHLASVYLDQPGCSTVSLKQELGTGASSKVYKGAFEHLRRGLMTTGRPVAVKMFKDGDTPGCSALGSSFASKLFQSMQQMTHSIHSNAHNFLAELDKLVLAKHPNIVTPIGYIGKRPEGECGLVMELMDESLYDYLQKMKERPLKELDMLDLMLEIARGMRFLHECELVHLDLKPGNVLLRFSNDNDHPPEVKLADLGLTTLSDFFRDEMKCQDMVPLGTSCYMAPEIRSQKVHYDDKVDVFSYGTICFNILIGNPNACCFSGSIPHFYEAVETGCWKLWVQGRNPFLVKLLERCWNMDPSMRPTFATLCMLLQQAIQCLLAPSFLWSATQCLCPASMTQLKELNDDKRWGHLQIYKAISVYHTDRAGFFADLEVIERSVLHFERENADALPMDEKLLLMERLSRKLGECGLDDDGENGREVETDVSIFLKAWAKGRFDKAISSTSKTLMGTSTCWWKREEKSRGLPKQSAPDDGNLYLLLESCLNEADPLIFIKAHAYLNLLQTFNRGALLGDLSNSIDESPHVFNFNLDEARLPLRVDTSLIPLLVGFWMSRDTINLRLLRVYGERQRDYYI